MRFFTVTLAAVFASVVLAVASTENPIIKPDGKDSIVAGKPYVIKWKPTTKGGITLTLRQGSSTDLKDVSVIVSNADNNGEYTWTPDASLPTGDNYAIMITSAKDEQNYTPLLKIDSDTKAKPSSASSSSEHSKGYPSKTSSHHSAHITPASNSTISKHYSNSTISTKKPKKSGSTTLKTSSTTESSTTPTSASASASASASSTSASGAGAMAVARSPIALVACLIAGFVFLN
ncbi:Ser-Thr-rich glycosyl-phosphatidyl-inositol-anchored membrane family-domain-containing protein [Trichophaea hybrida]|nr:Ser-Thr-rich glycosyl-phosphatidyl-inositol-anchored membrane family-domain-containing protein [Trichophaea hybrida]